MTINLKDYAGKLVVVTLRNELMLVGLVTNNTDYSGYSYNFDDRYYTRDGLVLIDEENPYDIIDIVLADEEPEPIINRVEVITHEEGRVYVNWKKDNKITTSLQDDGRTLKVFVNKNTEEPMPTKCCYNDCGWCYAPSHINNNAINGACKNPNECPTLNEEKTMYPKQPKPINMVEIETKRWATALSNFIDELGGDSPFLWEWNEITPTPEKVVECLRELVDFHMTIAADNELDECCELISKRYSGCTYERQDTAKVISTWMRNTRRPKPTLKSQALRDFETVRKHSDLLPEILDNIENALKSIPE